MNDNIEFYKKKFIENFMQYNVKESYEDECTKIYILNPKCENNITVYFDDDEMTFVFSMYHTHLYYDEDDFDFLIKLTEDILSSKKAIMVVYSNKRWLCSDTLTPEEVPLGSINRFTKFCFPTMKEFRNELKLGGTVNFYYWDNNKDKFYKIIHGKIICENK